ncbi:hypothetical protein PVK06_044399 [Gossypium arboreum]|uniref:Uncharacterized protein n=1 Tax=Gossypium arboreum TaxID=29729 RepID=A0ABR0MR66_GOSAR|nr:hypothetical protein PVK06_044399 [Gossypium arboreum]
MLASSALPIVLVAILHLSLSSVAIACYPDFQLLNIKQTFIGTKIPRPLQTSEITKFPMDVKRVANLLRRLSGGEGHDGGVVYEVNDFGSDVVSGIDQGSGEYFVRIGVGYNAGQCRYEVLYGDGSYTTGTLALETLTSSRTVVKNVAIGCGHINRGMFIGVAGLLSLGGGSLSLGGQLGGQIVGAFSYCLVNQGSDVSGSLEFGRGAMLAGGPILTLPASNFLIPVDDMGTFCLAFASSTFGLSIIGNIQQEGIQISFDGAHGSVGFGPNVC